MYLNIINNIRHESKRKNKKTDYLLEQEKNNLENESSQIPMIMLALFTIQSFMET
ncbi:MAG: hypothetical protein CM15mP118_1620 [Alphaproteobacteria bacterium]|nr:MAG: hypothetical protein CM15mP118_1620 [Alphaproteobacteria bacterium]